MEIYYKNSRGRLVATTLMKALDTALKNSEFKMDNGSFPGENYNWIGIIQKNNTPSEVTINIIFEDDGNTIIGVKVFETPIIEIVDHDNTRQLI